MAVSFAAPATDYLQHGTGLRLFSEVWIAPRKPPLVFGAFLSVPGQLGCAAKSVAEDVFLHPRRIRVSDLSIIGNADVVFCHVY